MSTEILTSYPKVGVKIEGKTKMLIAKARSPPTVATRR
jgi:hypothetical protein